jgi:hypothetical protein
MTRKAFLRKTRRRLPLAVAAAGAALMLHSCGKAEAEQKADPVAVQRYLDQIEADEQMILGEKKKAGPEKRIKSLVEGAATRAPSEATLNKLETVVSG